MAVSNVIERLGKAIFESPFGANRISKDAPELAEIRLAALDAVKAKSHRVGGKNVFAYDLIRIELLGVPEEQADVFRGEFLSNYFSQELKAGLARSGYRFPAGLQVEMRTNPKMPARGEHWLSIETAMQQAETAVQLSRARKPAKLLVIHGTANHSQISLDKARINIGRTAEVYRAAGPSRRNDLAFSEDNEINRTVSREHAHILYSQKTGEYRLINDRSYKGEANCGIWIVREGLSQPVHRSARGTVLKNGDEVHLGTAVIRFQVK
ncbi:MAG: FHA domain-containing protein [Bryobacteraceae bacterium]